MTTSVTCLARPSSPAPSNSVSTRSAIRFPTDLSVGPVQLLVYLAAHFARQAGHCLELLAGGGEKPLRRAEVLQQGALARRADPRQLVEHGPLEHAAVAAAAVVVD